MHSITINAVEYAKSSIFHELVDILGIFTYM